MTDNDAFSWRAIKCSQQHPPQYYSRLGEKFLHTTPHGKDLNMQLLSATCASAKIGLEYQDILLGDIDRQLIHSGVISSLADSVSGLAVFCALPQLETIATLDLRLDHMRPAVANQDLIAQAVCYRLSKQIAFTHALIYQQRHAPVAVASATFMRASSRQNFMQQALDSEL